VASLAQQEPQPQDGAATKAGERLDDLGRAIRRSIADAEDTVREGLNKTGETVRDGFARTKESVQGMGLVPRVYGRLHWDKALHSSPLFVKADGGTVTIRGTVPDEAAKAKAISLVKDTFGVTRVVVQLAVTSPSVGTTPTETITEPKTTIEPKR
jgi:hyperosmotically inducible protein